jgi:prefoldin subunit 5
MDPEISALMSVYQKRLNDMTAQAIAFEARIAVLTATLQQIQQQAPAAEAPAARKRSRKAAETTDAGSF